MRQIVHLAFCLLTVATVYVFAICEAHSQDWPQWRGPNRDGVIHGIKVPTKWPKDLQLDWKVAVGEGGRDVVHGCHLPHG